MLSFSGLSETPEVPGYRVLSVVGRGAMATVYRAQHSRLGKTVALKIMDPLVAEDDEYRERFLREARAAAKLNHQNLVRALDSGYENGVYFLAMELVEGDDLRRRIEQEGKIPEHVAFKIALSVAHALDEASRHGIVHRDVKPENILLAPDGTVKLADLGLAKVRGEDLTLTKKGLTVGTVAYFAPEQALGQPDLDVRTDIYALGATLYAALSGELPFGRGENAPETMRRILTEPPPALAEIAPWVSPQGRALVERFMEKDRKKRPQTARDAVRIIEAALRGEMPGMRSSSKTTARRSARVSSGRSAARTTRRRTQERTVLRERKVGLGLAALGTTAGLAVGLAAVAFLHVSEERAASPIVGAIRSPAPEERPALPSAASAVKPLAADSDLGRALKSLFRATLAFEPLDRVTFRYEGTADALADFDGEVSATKPGEPGRGGERVGPGLVVRLDQGRSTRLVHKALLRTPVVVAFDVVLGNPTPDARLEAVLTDARGARTADAVCARVPFGRDDQASHAVQLELAEKLTTSVDGATTSTAVAWAGPARFALELDGGLSVELRNLTITGRVDRDWLERAGPLGGATPLPGPGTGEEPR
jgi:tRNA A-37 threonylcarbamoyl transferase component Bud32